MNYQAFLAVIALLAAVYAFFTRQAKIGLGMLVYAVAFFLLVPDITFGIKADFLNAIALVLFVGGSFAIVWKKPVPKPEVSQGEAENKNE